MHDIGKIVIPDRILMKPGKLTDAERQVVRTHTTKGGEIIDDVLKNFGLDGLPHVDVLRTSPCIIMKRSSAASTRMV